MVVVVLIPCRRSDTHCDHYSTIYEQIVDGVGCRLDGDAWPDELDGYEGHVSIVRPDLLHLPHLPNASPRAVVGSIISGAYRARRDYWGGNGSTCIVMLLLLLPLSIIMVVIMYSHDLYMYFPFTHACIGSSIITRRLHCGGVWGWRLRRE